ncbi:MAG: hypothetical protein HY820_14105 [Acidobacteria bacterium]|nr:hypothetical protein [Acidobacteriota bacterium]
MINKSKEKKQMQIASNPAGEWALGVLMEETHPWPELSEPSKSAPPPDCEMFEDGLGI